MCLRLQLWAHSFPLTKIPALPLQHTQICLALALTWKILHPLSSCRNCRDESDCLGHRLSFARLLAFEPVYLFLCLLPANSFHPPDTNPCNSFCACFQILFPPWNLSADLSVLLSIVVPGCLSPTPSLFQLSCCIPRAGPTLRSSKPSLGSQTCPVAKASAHSRVLTA